MYFTTHWETHPLPDAQPIHILNRLRWGIQAEGSFRIAHNTDDDCRRAGL